MSKNNAFNNGIVILGAGNVATHLALALFKSKYNIRFIYNRTFGIAEELATMVNAHYSDDLKQIPVDAGLYIICVKDDAIEEIVKSIKVNEGIIIHTSGGTSINLLKKYTKKAGVLYPLQTFTKNRSLNFQDVPIFIEASDKETKNVISELANNLSSKVVEVDSNRRKAIHLAAVFACNFVNYMFVVSSELMKDSGNSFELLKPLINETVNKAIDMQPQNAQTGPAMRNDKKIMEEHLNLLKDYPEFEKIYRIVSDSIYKSKNN